MVDQADQLNIKDLVFDDKNEERPPWKCCGQSCARSLLVFFCQVFFVFLVFTFCAVNLTINYDSSDLSAFWAALLGASVGYLIPNPKP